MSHYPRFVILVLASLMLASGHTVADSECQTASASIQAHATVVASLGVVTEPSHADSQIPQDTFASLQYKWLLFQPDDQAMSVRVYSRRGDVVSDLTIQESELSIDSLLLAISGAEKLALHRQVHQLETAPVDLIVTLASPDN